MNFAASSRRAIAAAAFAFLALAHPAAAQDNISDTHLAAARAAIAAIGATDEFDMMLPQAAHALKTEMIQKDPHLQADISEIVDRTALALAARRGDLEREAALAYARTFTEAQLNEIAAFYNTETGKKLLTDGPNVIREVYQAAEIWQRGIARDLAEQAGEELGRRVAGTEGGAEGGAEAGAEGGEQPAGQ